MNEIIKVDEETMTVSARDLHDRLEISTPYTMWFSRMCEYGFSEGTDFFTKMLESSGGRPSQDADITIDMAKQICMIQRTEIGRKVRQYFLDLEKAWNTPEQVLARALKIADQTIASLKIENRALIEDNERMKPKEEFFDTVADSKTAISMNEVAKVLDYEGYGRNKLFQFLRDQKILNEWNVPYQRYVDAGWFRVIEQHYSKNGEPQVTTKTLVYQKGVDKIRKLLDTRGKKRGF